MEPNDTTEGSGNHVLVGRRAAAARSAASTPDRRARLAPLLLLVLVGVGLGAAGCTADGNGVGGVCRTVINCISDLAPICDAATLTCRGCSMSSPSDDVGCKNRKPETPRCGPSGACVACLNNADCAARDLRKPACQNYTCQPCTQPSDCQSNICATDGSCVPNTQVLFVDNADGNCAGGTPHEGTEMDPLCEIGDAVRKAVELGRHFITVRPSFRPYQPVAVTNLTDSLTIEISGLPGSGAKTVQIQGGVSTPALWVASSSGKQTQVTVRRVEVLGVSTNSAVFCEQGAALKLYNVRIWSGKDGVTASGCNLTIDGAYIYNNTSNGVYLNASTFSITNTMLWANRETAIALATGNTGAIRFSTIYNNGAATKVPGIDCGSTMHTVESSILFNNERQMSGMKMLEPQVAGCTLNNVVTNDPRAQNGTLTGARYVSTIDFIDPDGLEGIGSVNLRLKKDTAANRDCCIDKAQASGVDRDIDETRRPLGAAADIGAHEAQ